MAGDPPSKNEITIFKDEQKNSNTTSGKHTKIHNQKQHTKSKTKYKTEKNKKTNLKNHRSAHFSQSPFQDSDQNKRVSPIQIQSVKKLKSLLKFIVSGIVVTSIYTTFLELKNRAQMCCMNPRQSTTKIISLITYKLSSRLLILLHLLKWNFLRLGNMLHKICKGLEKKRIIQYTL